MDQNNNNYDEQVVESSYGEYETEYCNYYQTLGFCLEPEVCPCIHEFAVVYFSDDSSSEDEDEDYDKILPTDDEATIAIKK